MRFRLVGGAGAGRLSGLVFVVSGAGRVGALRAVKGGGTGLLAGGGARALALKLKPLILEAAREMGEPEIRFSRPLAFSNGLNDLARAPRRTNANFAARLLPFHGRIDCRGRFAVVP